MKSFHSCTNTQILMIYITAISFILKMKSKYTSKSNFKMRKREGEREYKNAFNLNWSLSKFKYKIELEITNDMFDVKYLTSNGTCDL